MIPTEKLREILEKAGKATPGPWRLERDGKDDGRTGEGWPLLAFRDCSVMSPPMHADRIAYHGDDAAFIAEANPATLQSIIRELLAWRQAASKYISKNHGGFHSGLCERIDEWSCDCGVRDINRVAGGFADEVLRKIEEAGEGDVCR